MKSNQQHHAKDHLAHLLQKPGNVTIGMTAALIAAHVIAQVVTRLRRKLKMASPQQNGTPIEAKRNKSLDNQNHPALIPALHRAPAGMSRNTAKPHAAVAKCVMAMMPKPRNTVLLQKRRINPVRFQLTYHDYPK